MKKIFDINLLYLLMLILYDKDDHELSKFSNPPLLHYKDTAISSTYPFTAVVNQMKPLITTVIRNSYINKQGEARGTDSYEDLFKKMNNTSAFLTRDKIFVEKSTTMPGKTKAAIKQTLK